MLLQGKELPFELELIGIYIKKKYIAIILNEIISIQKISNLYLQANKQLREIDTGQKKKKLHSNYKVPTKKFNETNYIFSMQLKTCIDYWLLQFNFKSKIK